MFRFETEAFLSPRPGAQPGQLVAGEPGPVPDPTLRTLKRALDRGVRFLNRQLAVALPLPEEEKKEGAAESGPEPKLPVDGSYPASYAPVTGTSSQERAGDFALGRVCEASLALAEEGRARVLIGATQLVLDRALGVETPRDLGALESGAQAALLKAISAAPDALQKRYAAQARRLARALRTPSTGARLQAATGLLAYARATRTVADDLRAWALIGDLGNLDLGTPEAREVLIALSDSSGAQSEKAAARLLSWGQERLLDRTPATPQDRLTMAAATRVALARQHAQAVAFQSWTLKAAGEVLALQLDDRHAPFCRDIRQAQGGFRDDLIRMRVSLGRSAECLLALRAAYRLVSE